MISIIIPVYNNYQTLPKCLDSVANQTCKDLEIIVVDDGSFDVKKIEKIVCNYKNIKFFRQDNKGAPAARNKGFAESKGEYLLFLDSDIVLKDNALEVMLNRLKNSNASYCYSSFKLGWKKFKYIDFDYEKLKKINFIHTSSLIKRDCFLEFDEKLKKFQDWDLWLRLAKNNYFGVGIDKVLFTIIDTKGTMSQWFPRLFYKLPWPILGFTPQMIKKYQIATNIIKNKHNL